MDYPPVTPSDNMDNFYHPYKTEEATKRNEKKKQKQQQLLGKLRSPAGVVGKRSGLKISTWSRCLSEVNKYHPMEPNIMKLHEDCSEEMNEG